MILLHLLPCFSLGALNSPGASKCKKKALISETTHALHVSLACSQYLYSQTTTVSMPITSVHYPLSREWCLHQQCASWCSAQLKTLHWFKQFSLSFLYVAGTCSECSNLNSTLDESQKEIRQKGFDIATHFPIFRHKEWCLKNYKNSCKFENETSTVIVKILPDLPGKSRQWLFLNKISHKQVVRWWA